MLIHWLQHVPFEGPGAIGEWASGRGHRLQGWALQAGAALPTVGDDEGLIVLGGPMGANDEALHPWLAGERDLLREVIARGRPCLGICLGAQLMAHALGATVAPGPQREVGWIPITFQVPADDPLAGRLPASATVFHWHGDQFTLPPGATCLASSPACPTQIVRCGPRALALQCHLETRPLDLDALCRHCPDDHQRSGAWVQSAGAMQRQAASACAAMRPLLELLLDHCFAPC
jgi:GMP synthase-like glutamine amidotransferase